MGAQVNSDTPLEYTDLITHPFNFNKNLYLRRKKSLN